jgi:hypothetical protein
MGAQKDYVRSRYHAKNSLPARVGLLLGNTNGITPFLRSDNKEVLRDIGRQGVSMFVVRIGPQSKSPGRLLEEVCKSIRHLLL